MTPPEPPITVTSTSVTASFKAPSTPYGPGHRGIDLPAPDGSAVPALADGIVAFVGHVGGKPVVTVRLASGMRTTYEPVVGLVQVGEQVSRGQILGTTAAPSRGGHCAAAGCVHVGLRLGQQYLDPASLLSDAIVLKP